MLWSRNTPSGLATSQERNLKNICVRLAHFHPKNTCVLLGCGAGAVSWRAEDYGGFPALCLDAVLWEQGLGSPSLEVGQKGSEDSDSQVL